MNIPVLRSRVTDDGRTTLPASLRARLGLREGDDVVFVQEGDRFYVARADAVAEDDPYVAFGEWASAADAEGYAAL